MDLQTMKSGVDYTAFEKKFKGFKWIMRRFILDIG